MAIGWMSALKIIPWGSVLESAPHIVKAAKHLFAATRTDTSGFSSAPPFSESSADPDKLEKRIRLLEAKIIELSDEQQASVQLIKSLAEQKCAGCGSDRGLQDSGQGSAYYLQRAYFRVGRHSLLALAVNPARMAV